MANKIKKCATNRFWLKYFLLTIITLGIYSLVFWVRFGKDLNRIKEKAGFEGKNLMNYIGALFLGIITLGIVPFVWVIRAILRTYHAADELKVQKHGSVALVIIFNTLLSWTLVCPIIAMHKYYKTMNNICKWYNEQLEAPAAIEETPAPVAEEPAAIPAVEETPVIAEQPTPVEETPAPVAEEPAPVVEEKPVEEKVVPAKKPAPKKPAPAAKKPAAKKPAPAKKEKPAPAPIPAEKENKPSGVGANGAKIYHISKRKDDGKWQVKFANGSKAIKLFDTQAEAIDYAKTLAKNQEGSIRIHSVKGKIRK